MEPYAGIWANGEKDKAVYLSYYQWVPLVLFLQVRVPLHYKLTDDQGFNIFRSLVFLEDIGRRKCPKFENGLAQKDFECRREGEEHSVSSVVF